jgi:hypothetical protein
MLVFYLNHYSTMKMEAIYFSEMSVEFHWTIHYYTAEDMTLLIKHLQVIYFFNFKYISLGDQKISLHGA